MEQAIWVAFGVIAVVLGLTIVANLITINKEESRYIDFREGIEKLKNKCDFVCDSSLDTYMAQKVKLPSGTRLYTDDNRICGHLNMSEEHSDETKCMVCKCDVVMDEELNLQTELAREMFEVHEYSCYFERRENDVAMECKG